MRHVLSDPHERKGGLNTAAANNSQQKKNKKVNWDAATSFPLPRELQPNVVGCRLLLSQQQQQQQLNQGSTMHIPRSTIVGTPEDVQRHQNEVATSRTLSSLWSGGGGAGGAASGTPDSGARDKDASDIFYSTQDLFQHVDVVTYFIRAEELMQTRAVIARIKASSPSAQTTHPGSPSGGGGGMKNTTHHRIVFIPQITAIASRVLQDAGINVTKSSGTASGNVSVVSLQLDLFPLESDLISLEYTDAMRESTAVNNTPSHLVGTAARALLKLQDVTGPISRIQTIGKLSEDVLARMLNQSVDEYIAEEQYADDDGDDYDGHDDYAAMQSNDQANPQQAASSSSSSSLVSDSNGVCMLVLDRRLDLVTPMVTPLTYAGLLDEVMSIDSGFIHIPERVINPPDDDEEDSNAKNKTKSNSNNNPFDDDDGHDGKNKKKGGSSPTLSSRNEIVALGVHAGDSLFAEVRDQHVEKFGSFLQNQAIALKESHQNFTSKGTQKDLNEIHQFVKQIPVRQIFCFVSK